MRRSPRRDRRWERRTSSRASMPHCIGGASRGYHGRGRKAAHDDRRTDGAPLTLIHIEKKKANGLAWLLLALGILAVLLALGHCSRRDAVATSSTSTFVAEAPSVPRTAAIASTAAWGGHLTDQRAAPHAAQFSPGPEHRPVRDASLAT